MSNTKIYVGGLPDSYGDRELMELLLAHGIVKSARVMMDRESGRSRGFGFVEMDDAEGAQRAVEALDGTLCDDQVLRVKEALERPPRTGAPPGAARPHFAGQRREDAPRAGGHSGGHHIGNGSGYGPAHGPRRPREDEPRGRKIFKGKPKDDDFKRDDFDPDY